MKEIYIKYNPYKLETIITIDGQSVKENSALNIEDKRLQEWIEDLPMLLVDECNVKDFNIKFHGTNWDYDDVLSVVNTATDNGINIHLEHIETKDVADKEQAIEKIFEEIQKGPFDELKQKDVIEAFENARNNRFPISVIATVSAGKSTLINVLLNKILMPSQQRACTAIITEVIDNDKEDFIATVYDKDDELIETCEDITLEKMKQLNKDEQVSRIVIEGDIPFVNTSEMSLELVDTPGTNNARDLGHKAATYRMLNESSKSLVLYILNAAQFGVNDDNELLSFVAENMKIKGKQSKDRFIFVLNKLDEYKNEDDDISQVIEDARKYLADKGIENANIFPASAITALDIRTICKDIEISSLEDIKRLKSESEDDELDEALNRVKNSYKNKKFHFEKYAPLSTSENEKVLSSLLEAKETNNLKAEALIHTGIPSVEQAINVYINKYARTAKIKNIVDTFSKKLESTKSFERTKEEILVEEEKRDEIQNQIIQMQNKLKSGEEAAAFRNIINNMNFDRDIGIAIKNIKEESNRKIRIILDGNSTKMSLREAENKCKEFSKEAENIQAEIEIKLENVINNNITKTAQGLLDKYKEKLKVLSSELKIGDIKIEAFDFVKGESISNVNNLISKISKTESYVKEESKWVKNENKKWYKPWTWFQENGHYTKEVIGEREYIETSELAKRFFAPIQKQILVNLDSAQDYAKKQIEFVKSEFECKFTELDTVLEKKLEELNSYTKDKENAEILVQKTKDKLLWLEKIQSELDSVLEI